MIYLPLVVGTSMAAISKEGELIWKLDFPSGSIGQSPAIGINQVLYVASYKDEFVYAIK